MLVGRIIHSDYQIPFLTIYPLMGTCVLMQQQACYVGRFSVFTMASFL